MTSARASPSSDPSALQKLLWSLRPTLRDLFQGYGIPEEEASVVLRDTIAALARDCAHIGRPRTWLLETLEQRCRAYRAAAAPAEEKEGDDGPSRG